WTHVRRLRLEHLFALRPDAATAGNASRGFQQSAHAKPLHLRRRPAAGHWRSAAIDRTLRSVGACTPRVGHREHPSLPAMQHPPNITPPGVSRRSFLKASSALAAGAPLLAGLVKAQSGEAKRPLMAYVGTFSSPLRDVLPTQVDLPPGNGRGIHIFQMNRTTGVMTPSGVYALGTSPSCLALNAAGTHLYSANETDRVGDGKEGTVSAFVINRVDGQLKPLNTVRSGGAGPTYLSVHPSGRFVLVANYFGGSVAVL